MPVLPPHGPFRPDAHEIISEVEYAHNLKHGEGGLRRKAKTIKFDSPTAKSLRLRKMN